MFSTYNVISFSTNILRSNNLIIIEEEIYKTLIRERILKLWIVYLPLDQVLVNREINPESGRGIVKKEHVPFFPHAIPFST